MRIMDWVRLALTQKTQTVTALTAIQLPRPSIILHPLMMISKRIERGEQIDVFELFNGVAAQVDTLRDAGK